MTSGAARVLLVDHYISHSPIHGLGVFCAEDVEAGRQLWRFDAAIDFIVPAITVAGLPPHVIKRINNHSEYMEECDAFLMCCDGDQYMNHSDQPNTVKSGVEWFAARNIFSGEELTCDYRQTLVLGYNPSTGRPHSHTQIVYD